MCNAFILLLFFSMNFYILYYLILNFSIKIIFLEANIAIGQRLQEWKLAAGIEDQEVSDQYAFKRCFL